MDLRVAAYAIITDDDGRLLLAHWTEGREPAWTLPGGGLEPGEDPAHAVRREVLEETGYRVAIDELLGIHSRVIPAARRIVDSAAALQTIRIVYRCRVVSGALRNEAHGSTDEAGWFTPTEVQQVRTVKLVGIAQRMAGLVS